ncbi:MAG: hypothetical protein QY322_01880 [bacterium]|nr:MAG: hypothetical protein QY322_01880 [bacterium]
MENLGEQLDRQIEATKSVLNPISMQVFGYSDELKRKLDPEISTIRSNMLAIYDTKSTHPQRLSRFLDVVNKVIDNNSKTFEETSISESGMHKLMLLDVLIKCGVPLIKKVSDDDFNVLLMAFENDTLPKSLTSGVEVDRLNQQLKADFDVTVVIKDSGFNEVGETGNELGQTMAAVDILKSSLSSGVSADEALSKISKLD